MQSFELHGTRYYQQSRKCGKATCHCRDGQHLHGPYWYARPPAGRIRYIGKSLPEAIAQAHSLQQRLRPHLLAKLATLQTQVRALQNLLHAHDLTSTQRAALSDLGYAALLLPLDQPPRARPPLPLVSTAELQHTQDALCTGRPGTPHNI